MKNGHERGKTKAGKIKEKRKSGKRDILQVRVHRFSGGMEAEGMNYSDVEEGEDVRDQHKKVHIKESGCTKKG